MATTILIQIIQIKNTKATWKKKKTAQAPNTREIKRKISQMSLSSLSMIRINTKITSSSDQQAMKPKGLSSSKVYSASALTTFLRTFSMPSSNSDSSASIYDRITSTYCFPFQHSMFFLNS
ncbi:hypothetical protein V6Z11_A11G259000 [Gossypium hirsutum]